MISYDRYPELLSKRIYSTIAEFVIDLGVGVG